MKSRTSITVQNRSNRRIPLEIIKQGVAAVCTAHQLYGEISILIISDKEMHQLNQSTRQVDESTDVLTFPAPEFAEGELGDIAIAIGFVERGASARQVPLSHEAAFLAIHGALHLAGFDDHTEEDLSRMVVEMNRAAAAVGIKEDQSWESQPHTKDDA
jgi:rRNA maturation RNase YbeY